MALKLKELLQKIERQFENATEKDKLGMILSNFVDIGSSSGGAISVKQFDELSDTIIEFYKRRVP